MHAREVEAEGLHLGTPQGSHMNYLDTQDKLGVEAESQAEPGMEDAVVGAPQVSAGSREYAVVGLPRLSAE